MSMSNKDKLSKLKHLLTFAIVLFCVTLAFYFYTFHNGFSTDHADWGTFGDFIGGTLNPIFALFTLFAIIYTIKIQTEELELSREELKATREELAKSSKAQQEQSDSFKIQNDSIKLQSFEATFFQLTNLFLQTREHIKIHLKPSKMRPNLDMVINNEFTVQFASLRWNIQRDTFKEGDIFSYEALKKYLEIFKQNYRMNYDTFNENYESNTGTYFIQIYQILKFIKYSQIDDKQFYVNLLRAQFTKEELEFLFYHCLGTIGESKFKPLVEKFEFFEHLVLNEEIERKLIHYSESAFGKNENILSKHKELKEEMDNENIDY